MATSVDSTDVLMAFTVASTSGREPPQASPAAASPAITTAARTLRLLIAGLVHHAGLIEASHLAVVVQRDLKAQHAQVAARPFRQTLLDQLVEVLVHVLERRVDHGLRKQ